MLIRYVALVGRIYSFRRQVTHVGEIRPLELGLPPDYWPEIVLFAAPPEVHFARFRLIGGRYLAGELKAHRANSREG